MVILREGIDKVMLTLSHKSKKEYPYPKDIALMYSDRLRRLKFSDRYSMTIEFNKYCHDSWKYADEVHYSWGATMLLRLDGLRQMRVLLNCMRMYNLENELPLYDKRLHDDNVVIPDRVFHMGEFIDLMKREVPKLINEYCELRQLVFNDLIEPKDVEVNTHQIELVTEGIGLHTSDVEQTFKDHVRCDSFKVYHNESNTHYFNTSNKRQLKMYQKGVGILRLEATLNRRVDDIVFNWNEHTWLICESLDQELRDLMESMNIPNDWWKKRKMSLETLYFVFADALGIYKEGNVVDVDTMKVLVNSTNFSSKMFTRKDRQKLMRKKLLRHLKHGTYVPSDRLLGIQQLFSKLERVGDTFEC